MSLQGSTLSACTRLYGDLGEASRAKRVLNGTAEAIPCAHGASGWHLRNVPPVPAAAGKKPVARRDTGFSAETKLMIRARAGGGDPEQARCEATGVFLGLYGGECQHVIARGRGGRHGTAALLYNSVQNGVLLSHEAHALAESRDPHMKEMGFWRPLNEVPGVHPIMLASQGDGVTVYLDEFGGYSSAPSLVPA